MKRIRNLDMKFKIGSNLLPILFWIIFFAITYFTNNFNIVSTLNFLFLMFPLIFAVSNTILAKNTKEMLILCISSLLTQSGGFLIFRLLYLMFISGDSSSANILSSFLVFACFVILSANIVMFFIYAIVSYVIKTYGRKQEEE